MLKRWTLTLLTAASLLPVVAATAAAPAAGVVAPVAAASEECDPYVDPWNPACAAFDTDGDGWLEPRVRFTWPAETSTTPGATLLATATGDDLFRPVTVTFTRPVTRDDPWGDSIAFATVTLAPGALSAQVGMPVGGPGTEHFAAEGRDPSGRFLGDGSYEVDVDRFTSALAADLPGPRTVTAGAASQRVTGTISGGERVVVVQVRARDGEWVDVATGRSSGSGAFSVPVPTYWVGSHAFRVHAPATTLLTEASSGPGSLKVRRGYRPTGSTQHSLLGGNARWNACTPIRYAVNPARMRKGGKADLRHALREVSAATGLRFTSAGTTSHLPRPGATPSTPTGSTSSWRGPRRSGCRCSRAAPSGSAALRRATASGCWGRSSSTPSPSADRPPSCDGCGVRSCSTRSATWSASTTSATGASSCTPRSAAARTASAIASTGVT